LVLTGAVCILVLGRRDVPTRWKHVSAFVVVSSAPVGAWLIRNVLVAGTPSGDRPGGRVSALTNMGGALSTVLGWFSYGEDALLRSGATLLIVAALIALAVIPLRERWKRVRGRLVELAPVLLFVLIYSAMLIAGAVTFWSDRLATRLLSPLFVPVVLCLAVLVRAALSAELSPRLRRALGVTATALFLALMLGPVWRTAMLARHYARDHGVGLNSTQVGSSEIAARLFELGPPPSAVYSNDPAAVYFFWGVTTKLIPMRWELQSESGVFDPSALVGAWPPEGQALLVWFGERHRENLLTIQQLSMVSRMRTLEQFSDGLICAVVRGEVGDEVRPVPPGSSPPRPDSEHPTPN